MSDIGKINTGVGRVKKALNVSQMSEAFCMLYIIVISMRAFEDWFWVCLVPLLFWSYAKNRLKKEKEALKKHRSDSYNKELLRQINNG
jgi:hypothetical protein